MYLILERPFKEKANLNIEIFNECIVLVTGHAMFILTDWQNDAKLKWNIGFLMMATTLI